MVSELKELGINLGYRCNFRCAHCSVIEDPRIKLSASEVNLLAKIIEGHKFRSLLFVGGEPTLYIDIANDILSKAGDLSRTSVRITTNGHFANSKCNAIKTLASFVKLDRVQLSYDKFHSKFLPLANIRNLFYACKALKKKFNVTTVLENPMDILLLEKIKRAGKFTVGIQKVLPIGRAKTNHINHPYPSLDQKVLRKHCPNRSKIMYFCGRGFSTCCSSLVFNSREKDMIHPTIERHLNSKFYKTAVLSNFGRFARKLGVSTKDLRPEHSAPCTLCEFLFNRARESQGAYNVRP
ncbi:MAG TPA: hypothetical protein DCL44_02560 [Elusimicrobia bacterium]|nr:hypothetical protein [Elusimicrobiota bacterium]